MTAYSEILENKLPGLISGIYIYGSIALGAFDLSKSDVDILVITSRKLTAREIDNIKEIHADLGETHSLSKRMDGSIICWDDISKENKDLDEYPHFYDGIFYPSGYWDINSLTWWVVKNYGIRIAGKEISGLKIQTEWHDVMNTMSYNLNHYWTSKLYNKEGFLSDEAVEFAVLTLCRILFTLRHKIITSKIQAAIACLDILPEELHLPINEGVRIRQSLSGQSYYNSPKSRADEILEFAKFIIDLCNTRYLI